MGSDVSWLVRSSTICGSKAKWVPVWVGRNKIRFETSVLFFSLSLRSLWVGGNFVRFFPYFFISRGVFDGKGAARQWRRPTRENQQIIIAFFLVLLGLTWFSWVFLGFDEFHWVLMGFTGF